MPVWKIKGILCGDSTGFLSIIKRGIGFSGGYVKDIDYFYFCDCIIKQTSDYYEDEHGNKIIGSYQGLKFSFSGFGSVMKIGDNVKFQNDVFYVHSNSQIEIGDNTEFQDDVFYVDRNSQIEIGSHAKFQDDIVHIHGAQVIAKNHVCLRESRIGIDNKATLEVRRNGYIFQLEMNIGKMSDVLFYEEIAISGKANWIVGRKSKLEIGRRAKFPDGRIILGDASFFKIGNDFTVGSRYDFIVDPYTNATIGRDCMFSYDVYMRTNDGHSIFDIKTGENINSTYAIGKSRKIVIGNHVWIGMRCTILYHSRIGDGSMIGASSLVKSEIPNNCIAVGIPAKVIRTDIAWDREYGTKDITEISGAYIHPTEIQ